MIRTHSSTSNIIRVFIGDSTSTSGAGKTGLTFETSGLVISTICDNEATAVTYAVGSSNVEDITTIGTYAAPSTNKCRFKAVDGTNHPGLYEMHFADARFSVASAKSLFITISGATGIVQTVLLVELPSFDLYDKDALFKRDLSAVTGESSRSLLNALRVLRNKWAISAGTLTIYKEDDSTSAFTSSLTTSGSAEPITASDPT